MRSLHALATAALFATITFASTVSAETSRSSFGAGVLGRANGKLREILASVRPEILEIRADVMETLAANARDHATALAVREQIRALRDAAKAHRHAVRDGIREDASAAAAASAHASSRDGSPGRRYEVGRNHGQSANEGLEHRRVQRARGANGHGMELHPANRGASVRAPKPHVGPNTLSE